MSKFKFVTSNDLPPDADNGANGNGGRKSISIANDGSDLSRTVLSSVEELRTVLDLMIDERVAELLEERNRLPKSGDPAYLQRVQHIDQQLTDYTSRKIQSWKLIDQVVVELTNYELTLREEQPSPALPFEARKTAF